MIFLYLVILSIILIIGLLVLFYIRTYDSISKIKNTNNDRLNRQTETDRHLDRKITMKTNANHERISKQKEEMLKKLSDITDRIDNLDKNVEEKIQIVKSKIKKAEGNIDDLEEKIKDEIDELNDRLPSTTVNNEDVIKLLNDLEDELGGEIDIIKENHQSLDDKVDILEGDFANWNEFKQETENAIKPIQESIKKMKNIIGDYTMGFDTATQKFKIRNNNIDPSQDGIDVLNAQINNTMTITPGGKLTFATIDQPYEISTGNENIRIDLPKSSSQLKLMNNMGSSTVPSHSFTGDGMATHMKGVQTPYIQIGDFRLVEKDGELIVQDITNQNENILS